MEVNMNILVCIKQVPGTTKVEVDEKTGVLKRDGIESKMNTYDLYALETALWIKEKLQSKITVITMGPPQASEIIKEAYMMGVDKGYLLTDKRFAGSDVLATSYTLSQGIEAIGEFDLIICGKQTTDGDTAQVGPSLAEFLQIPHVTWVTSIRNIDNSKIIVEQDMADSAEIVEITFPCLITVEKDIMQPRLPSYKRKLLTADWPVNVLTFDDLPDNDENKYGLLGSATSVERIFPPPIDRQQVIWEGNSNELSDKMFENLKKLKFI
jgi:electron transfer flavoprotein beta subunit